MYSIRFSLTILLPGTGGMPFEYIVQNNRIRPKRIQSTCRIHGMDRDYIFFGGDERLDLRSPTGRSFNTTILLGIDWIESDHYLFIVASSRHSRVVLSET
jgi:hypothetical protein